MKLLALAVVARCCTGFYVEGVRPSGVTRCVKALPDLHPEECWGRHACPDTKESAPWYPLAIYCTGGSVPIVVDERTIGCQARH